MKVVLWWLLLAVPVAAVPVCKQPLGALYSSDRTTFRVWAPDARYVHLNLYRTAHGKASRVLDMARSRDGSWAATVPGECAGLYYTYSTSFSQHVVDPYAQAMTAWNGRGIVVHDHTPLVPRPGFPSQDAIIYELHVRDFTIADNGGTYDALVKTGLPRIEALGVNTVQLMPILEFASDHHYGWGYDAAFYNSPEGDYSAHPDDASRVREVKHLVNEFHRHGIRVVLDVVFTHTAQNVFDRRLSFEGLAPGYYFRHSANGKLSNGSGCGNEFRSEAPMARRFVLDSLKHWVSDYGVDGFRFDLMGLMDVDTMRQAARELHQIDPNLLIYGEPWTAGDSPIHGLIKGKQRGLGIAVFNDHFRDALRGDVFHPKEPGFIEDGSHADGVRIGVMGSIDDFASSPLESINYIECHDNHTLWDRLALSAPSASEASRQAMDRLGAAILLTSQGIPFMQSGQEFLRSKGGSDNSYNLGDKVNALHWEELEAHRDVYEWYRFLIGLRRDHPMFRLTSAAEVRQAIHWLDTPPKTIGYILSSDKDSWARALLLFNGGDEPWNVTLPGGFWRLEAMDDTVGQRRFAAGLAVPAHAAAILSEER